MPHHLLHAGIIRGHLEGGHEATPEGLPLLGLLLCARVLTLVRVLLYHDGRTHRQDGACGDLIGCAQAVVTPGLEHARIAEAVAQREALAMAQDPHATCGTQAYTRLQ